MRAKIEKKEDQASHFRANTKANGSKNEYCTTRFLRSERPAYYSTRLRREHSRIKMFGVKETQLWIKKFRCNETSLNANTTRKDVYTQ